MSRKWKRLAARFAAEKSREIALQSNPNTPVHVIPEPSKVVNYARSALPPEFPLLISVAKARALVIGELLGGDNYLPEYDKIPRIFFSEQNPARHIIMQWFFYGMQEQIRVRLLSKVEDAHAALRIIRYTMTSRTAEHNHKMAGCAYLLNAWFEIKEPDK
jgi:hypothetical protein